MRIHGQFLAAILCLLAAQMVSLAADGPQRGLRIVVSRNAPADIKAMAASIAAGAKSNPLLNLCAGGRAVEVVESEQVLDGPIVDRALNHLVVVGLMNDPVIQGVWQREARVIDRGFYVFGFGTFAGNIGYIESDRNPFLHSEEIKAAPYETEIVTITGTTLGGVATAVHAFMDQGLVNGVVAANEWTRASPGLLDRDPLPSSFLVPSVLPERIGESARIGITQASEDEYRGVLEDTQVKPTEIWRAKYSVAGAWDGKGWQAAFKAYHNGLHRRATGNTLWVARFPSEEQATQAMSRIAAAAELKRDTKSATGRFTGQQPPFGFGNNDSPGPLSLWRKGEWVFMSTLSNDLTERVITNQSQP
jgi:hypothetical protein